MAIAARRHGVRGRSDRSYRFDRLHAAVPGTDDGIVARPIRANLARLPASRPGTLLPLAVTAVGAVLQPIPWLAGSSLRFLVRPAAPATAGCSEFPPVRPRVCWRTVSPPLRK